MVFCVNLDYGVYPGYSSIFHLIIYRKIICRKPLNNVENEWYCRDTSKKICAVMKSKGEAREQQIDISPHFLAQ